MIEINECDFCGDEFTYPPDPELQEHDYCVCNNCVDVAREQLQAIGDIEEDDDDMDLFNDEFDW